METIDLFEHGYDLGPDARCLSSKDRNLSYSEVRALSLGIANALSAQGLPDGAKVAVFSPNDPLGFVCVLGILRAGLAWIPLNPRNSVRDNCALLESFDCEFLFFHSTLVAEVGQFADSLPQVRGYVCIDRGFEEWPELGEWVDRAGDMRLARRPDSSALAAVVGTGGTTGRPKGVMLTHSNIEAYTAALWSTLENGYRPVYLVAAPMTHGAGFLAFSMMAKGASTVMLPDSEPQALLKAIQENRITDLFLPPTAIYNLLAQPNVREFDYSSLRHFFYSAAPMSVDKLREAIEVFGPVMLQSYGQTEAPNFCTILRPADHFIDGRMAGDDRLKSCGRPTPFVTLGIMDDAGQLLGTGEKGEIVVRGSIVMKGYYRNEAATEEVSGHGWHHTGDIGLKDQEGFVHIVDRKRDMIISGGFNVFPSEVEQVIWSHPSVRDCAVVGVPDSKWGEAVTAVVELKPGLALEAEELKAWCKERLGSVKAPKKVEFWSDLPRSPVGKVLKRSIRDRFWRSEDRLV